MGMTGETKSIIWTQGSKQGTQLRYIQVTETANAITPVGPDCDPVVTS